MAFRQVHAGLLDGPAAKSGLAGDGTLFQVGFRFVSKLDGGTHLPTIIPVVVFVKQFQIAKRQLTVIVEEKQAVHFTGYPDSSGGRQCVL